MKKSIWLSIFLLNIAFTMFAQSTSVTNNNTITIQGNVYYFKPATTPSSPAPTIGGTDFIGTGSWYGEDAAKVWASISDWAIEHCTRSDPPVKGGNGERVYISSVHAYKKNVKQAEGSKYAAGCTVYSNYSEGRRDVSDGITIYYWIVSANAQMEDGRRATRSFAF